MVMKNFKSLNLALVFALLLCVSSCIAAIPAGGLAFGLWATRDKSTSQEQKPASQEQKPDPHNYPAGLPVYSYSPSITLSWVGNSDSDLLGYKIYYRTNSTFPPYKGTGLVEGDSPIIVTLSTLKNPEDPEFTIHGLDKNKTYFFAITAYDKKGKESGFSSGILVKAAESDTKEQ
jgi:hypothetical protein